MNIRKVLVLLLPSCTLALSACKPADRTTENTQPAPVTAPDNTAVNQRDNSGVTPTPPDQSENASDLAITTKIRQDIVNDKSLSTNAHNVKIITSTGVVTLRGPVKSQQEKTAIEMKAKQVVGVTRVDNLIDIETNK